MKTLVILVLSLMVLALPGCGSDHYNPPPPFSTQILSDYTLDGEIAKFAGIEPVPAQWAYQSYNVGFNTAGAELRAFLQFPFRDFGGVPFDAVIQSATLDILINSLQPNPLVGSVPIRIDLVDLRPPTLFPNDFYRDLQPALETTTINPPISQADFGQPVIVDVTSLMQKAQRLALPRFQVRILVDPGAASYGLIEINDSTGINRDVLAPLLDVSYY